MEELKLFLKKKPELEKLLIKWGLGKLFSKLGDDELG